VSAPRAFHDQLDPRGVLVLTLDVPGEKLNTISRSMLEELDGLLRSLESRTDVKAVVLRSGKPDSFVAGADIKDFRNVKSALEGEMLARGGQALLGRFAALKVPVVAAIHGACLGGGLETVLCCTYRIASDDPRTGLGVPEVLLGLIPGAGGTQRLPRLIGLAKGLDMILTGRTLRAARAHRAGLVDAVVPQPILLEVAMKTALELSEGSLKPKRRGIPLRETLSRPLIFRKARASVLEKTGGHYPAPLKAIEAVKRGTATSLDEGLAIEARLFGELIVSDVSRALVSVFFATQDIKKDAGYPEGTQAREVRKLGVLGGGLMGAGIAGLAADQAGVSVRMKDTTLDALGRGLKSIHDVYDERQRRGSLSRLDLDRRLHRVSTTTDYTGFRRADLVIEAVFEDLELKRRVLREVEDASGDECVFASNTSALPICEIARDARRPELLLGMHFFSPVHKMPLLEIVVTPRTGAFTTATAVAFGRRLGKHVIVVRDGPGFYTTRTLAPYLNEAARMIEEGAAIDDVDQAMTKWGFPVGPATLLDEVGIDVGAKVAKTLHHAFGERMAPPPALEKVLDAGRLGRKSRRGFYRYGDKRKQVDRSVYELLPFGSERKLVDPRDVQERLVFAFLNEAVHCLQDGVLRSPRDGDVGAIFGLGFPPFLGGPFRYLDQLGARFAVSVLEKLRGSQGERFAPAPLLVDMAKANQSFHA
jgi:3-hydroxyacyl-CoA dehydrogenase/enoyl-CoA hydratase/3-hydroxybutyryl-CoA epimerase